jgi:hypothetical protein
VNEVTEARRPAVGEHGWIPSTFLSITTRPAFPPLALWAHRLANTVEELQGPEAQAADLGALSECFNQTALVLTLSGDHEGALAVCEAQIAWADRLSHRHRDRGLLAYTLQPWINMGRLHLRGGRVAQSLRHFALAEAFAGRRTIELGSAVIDEPAWEAIVCHAGQIPQVLWTVYVVDSFKAYVSIQDLDALDALLSAARSSAPAELAPIVAEADVLRLFAQRRFDDAASVCSACRATTTQATFAFLEHDMACAIGRDWMQAARASGTTIEMLCRTDAFASIPPVGQIALLTQLDCMLAATGMVELARTSRLRAARIAHECGDDRSTKRLRGTLDDQADRAAAPPDPRARPTTPRKSPMPAEVRALTTVVNTVLRSEQTETAEDTR